LILSEHLLATYRVAFSTTN
jgi:hypothetical protein